MPSIKLPGQDPQAGHLSDRGKQLEKAADIEEHTQQWQTLFAEVPDHFCSLFRFRYRVAKPRLLIIADRAEEGCSPSFLGAHLLAHT